MKRFSQNKGPKHRGTFPFHPGNIIEVAEKIPAYHGSGKEVEYKRILPPLRDPKKLTFKPSLIRFRKLHLRMLPHLMVIL